MPGTTSTFKLSQPKMKYRIEWVKEKKSQQWQSKQQCVVYDDESALHIMKNLQKDPKVSLIDVIPVF